MSDEVIKTKVGVDANGMDKFNYNWHDHPGFQDVDPRNHTHVAIVTGPLGGSVSLADGTSYDMTEQLIVVPIKHADELVVKIHDVHRLAGLTTEDTPTIDEVRNKREASAEQAAVKHGLPRKVS
jgi:hypothetical protein